MDHDNDKYQYDLFPNDDPRRNHEPEKQEVQDVQEEEAFEHKDQDKQTNKRSFPQLLLAGVVGGMITAALIAILIVTNVIPINDHNHQASTGKVSADTEDTHVPAIADLTSQDTIDPATIDELSKAVVGIVNLRQQDIWSASQEAGAGSGIIYKKENGKAYVVTNNHVVKDAQEVEVEFKDEKRVKAKVLGTDELTDLAVLEIDGSEVEFVAKIGSSEDLHVGETLLAIGNPLGMDLSGSVTKGIVSGLNRSIQVDTNGDNQPDWISEVIQTDAAINPGNSGGALVNSKGEVIGINSMKIARQEVEGIGFAIPIDSALPIMEQLEKNGEVVRPFVGVSIANFNQVPPQYRNNIVIPEDFNGGMVVANVQTGSPADEAGLQQFDIITKIDEHDITSILDFRTYMYSETKVGDTVNMEIYRNGEKQTVSVTLAKQELE